MRADDDTRFTVRAAAWPRDMASLRAIRIAVFVVEQNVPEELEWDGIDPECLHALAEDRTGTPIGCGRLLPDGHIGRMAVLSDWRGAGVGAALLNFLIELARARGDREVILNAQDACGAVLRALRLRAGRRPVRGSRHPAPGDAARALVEREVVGRLAGRRTLRIEAALAEVGAPAAVDREHASSSACRSRR